MLARSTAWRHGDGRTCTKARSIRYDLAVADQQVRGLDVAMGEAGVPQPADEQPGLRRSPVVVDRRRSPISFAAVEELGDQQVLALGGDLDDAVGGGGRDAGVAQEPQRRSPRTRPAGGPIGTAPRPRARRRGSSGRACTSGRPDVVHGVELGEQVGRRGRPPPAAAAASSLPSRPARPASSRARSARAGPRSRADGVTAVAGRRRGAPSCPCGSAPGTPRSG